jgi:single-strand DNA-binding protein
MSVIGTLGADAELKPAGQGTVLRFRVACGRKRPGQGGGPWVEKTDWFNVSMFGKRTEVLSTMLKKGTNVLVEGLFDPREYTAKDGTTKTSLDITANEVVLLPSKTAPSTGGSAGRFGEESPDENGIPF